MAMIDKIAKLVAKGMKAGGMTKPATLTLFTAGIRTPGAVSAGTNPTSASYAARGLVTSYEARYIDGTIITAKDRKITLFGALIASGAVPVPGATITIAGTTYHVINVDDPSGTGATYECQARK